MMKTSALKLAQLALALCAALGANRVKAATPEAPSLELDLYPGLTVTGEVGAVYAIEYTTNLVQPNGPTFWQCLDYLELPASPYVWTDTSVAAKGRRFYRAMPFQAPANLIFVPPGTFRMGTPTNDPGRAAWEGPPTAVTISRGFWMGRSEVMQAEYQALMGSNPSWFNGDRRPVGGKDHGTDLSRPVEMVSWSDATNYCAKLTARELTAGRIPAGTGYRLPTEAEWEYACRAWTSTRFSYGADPGYTNLTDHAWYIDNSGDVTHPVGAKLPNLWGFHDFHGNVSEWCQNWWPAGAFPRIAVDPQGPDSGSHRVVRGGFWYQSAGNCRCVDLYYELPDSRFANIGFRVVLAPVRP